MKARIIQIVCSFYLVAMSLAVGYHWWSLRDLTQATPPEIPPLVARKPITPTPSAIPTASPTPILAQAAPASTAAPSSSRDEFYSTLLRQVENLQNQNRDLLDQLADTNRELMKLEFRVDTHSSQFRPLPVTEELQEAYVDDTYGVLPPRPLVIDEPPPFGE